MLANIGSTELLIIAMVLVVIFGTKRISELGRSLGETTKELHRVKKEYDEVANKNTFAHNNKNEDNKEEV